MNDDEERPDGDRLEEAVEAIDEGDLDGAQRLLDQHLQDHPDDIEAIDLREDIDVIRALPTAPRPSPDVGLARKDPEDARPRRPDRAVEAKRDTPLAIRLVAVMTALPAPVLIIVAMASLLSGTWVGVLLAIASGLGGGLFLWLAHRLWHMSQAAFALTALMYGAFVLYALGAASVRLDASELFGAVIPVVMLYLLHVAKRAVFPPGGNAVGS